MKLKDLTDSIERLQKAGVSEETEIFFSDNPIEDKGDIVWDNSRIIAVLNQNGIVMLLSQDVFEALRLQMSREESLEITIDRDKGMAEIVRRVREKP